MTETSLKKLTMEQNVPQSITMQALFLEKRNNTRQKNFYCVFRGREIGIFTTWPACEQRINGFSHSSYKGYATLEAAIEAMRQAGIPEPILYHRQDVIDLPPTMKSIEYNSHLSTNVQISLCESDMSLVDKCFEETHPKMYVTPSVSSLDANDPNKSISETEISFGSTSENLLPGYKETTSNSPKPNKCNCQSSDEILLLITQLSRKQDEIASLQNQELRHIKEQNANLQLEINALKEENISIISKLDEQMKYMERQGNYDKLIDLKKENDQLKMENDELLLQISSNKINTPVNGSDYKSDQDQVTHANMIVSPSSSKGSSPNTEKESITNTTPDKTLQCQSTSSQSSNLASNRRSHSIVCGEQKPDPLSVKYTKSDTSINDSDSEYEYQQFVHQRTNSRNQKEKENDFIKRNYLKIPPTCKNLLLGDSNMKNIQRKRFDKSGQTEIRTFRGASIKTLDNIIKKCSQECPQVQKVSICIGTIDCTRNPITQEQVIEDYDRLIETTRRIFPAASICILSIPPQSIPEANKIINGVNNHLFKLARRHAIQYSSCLSLWNCVAPNGQIEKGILYDRLHLSERGLSYLLKNVSRFFFRHRSTVASSQVVESTSMNPYDMSSFPALGSRGFSPPGHHDINQAASSNLTSRARNLPSYSDTYAMKLKATLPEYPPSYIETCTKSLFAHASAQGYTVFDTLV